MTTERTVTVPNHKPVKFTMTIPPHKPPANPTYGSHRIISRRCIVDQIFRVCGVCKRETWIDEGHFACYRCRQRELKQHGPRPTS